MNKLKIGIIGMGRMGITHYSIINPHPDIEIISVADTTNVVVSILKKYLKNIEIYKDYRELIIKSKPDAIIVCTPPDLHSPILELAAEHNIHTFVEKPYTVCYEDSIRLSKLFESKNLINQVGYVNRFNDVFHYVKEIIDDGVIGDVIRFKSEMFSNTITSKDEGKGWRGKHESGGGVIFEMASHAIDLINFLLGKPIKVSGTSINKIFSKNVEDIVSSTIFYNNGINGTIYVNWSDTSYRKPTNKIELFGSKGKILADQHSLKIFLNEANTKYNYINGWNTVYITDVFRSVPFYVRGNEFTGQLYHFIDLILGKKNNSISSFNDGADTQFVINEMFKEI